MNMHLIGMLRVGLCFRVGVPCLHSGVCAKFPGGWDELIVRIRVRYLESMASLIHNLASVTQNTNIATASDKQFKELASLEQRNTKTNGIWA